MLVLQVSVFSILSQVPPASVSAGTLVYLLETFVPTPHVTEQSESIHSLQTQLPCFMNKYEN